MQIFARYADGIERALALLRAGQLVGFPTETVCGLGCDLCYVNGLQRHVVVFWGDGEGLVRCFTRAMALDK